MKTLQQHIHEWKVNDNSIKNIVNNKKYFIYKLNKREPLHIFGQDNGYQNWPQFDDYYDKVYVNGEPIIIEDNGLTNKEYDPGVYKVEILHIDDVRDCSTMFCRCIQLIHVPLFNTKNVRDFNCMFCGCYNLETIPLFNTKKAYSLAGMFWHCRCIKKIPKFNTINVRNMSNMFNECYDLEEVPLFDTKNVNPGGMHDTFKGCDNLSEKAKYDWSKVYNFIENHKK